MRLTDIKYYLQQSMGKAYGNMRAHVYPVLGLTLCLLAAMSFSSCKEEIEVEEPIADVVESSKYYLSINVSMPNQAGTRSMTETDGGSNEDPKSGTIDESVLRSVEVFICVDNKIEFILEAEGIAGGNSAGEYNFKAEITDMEALAAALGGKDVQIMLVGNAFFTDLGHNLAENADGTYTNDASKATFSISNVTNKPIGDFGTRGLNMPLTNKDNYTFRFEKGSEEETLANLKALFDQEEGASHIYPYGETIELERAVARLEYKDKRPDGVSSDDNILKTENNFKIEGMNLYLQLQTMQPFNINKESYLFRHTAPGNLEKATSADNIFGDEYGTEGGNSYNWISNPDWTINEGVWSKSGAFLNQISVNSNATLSNDAYSITGSYGIITVDDEFKARTNDSNDGYHPMCYVTENTLPSTELMKDFEETTVDGGKVKTPIVTQYATGVAFKFLILDKNGQPLKYHPTRDNYPTEIINSRTSGIPDGEKWITITDPKTGDWIDVKPEEVNEEEYYYLTYIAPIVHNNPSGYDPKNGRFAPMYYGVVRNNTYQMRISSISSLPLPKDPKSMYLTLQIQVKDWNKRQNGFYF